MDQVKRFVGIDVAKLKLNMFIGSTGERFYGGQRRPRDPGLAQATRAGGLCDS